MPRSRLYLLRQETYRKIAPVEIKEKNRQNYESLRCFTALHKTITQKIRFQRTGADFLRLPSSPATLSRDPRDLGRKLCAPPFWKVCPSAYRRILTYLFLSADNQKTLALFSSSSFFPMFSYAYKRGSMLPGPPHSGV